MADTDRVWIRAHIEEIRETTSYISYTRAEWDAMTEDERENAVDDFGAAELANAGGYSVSVVDESEVPDEYLED